MMSQREDMGVSVPSVPTALSPCGSSPTVSPASPLQSTDAGITPGPWHHVEWECSPRVNEDGNRYWGIKPEKFQHGALYLEASGWMTEANAKLIAAAPELLNAVADAADYLVSVYAQIGSPDSPEGWSDPDAYGTYQVLTAAIAKAEGR